MSKMRLIALDAPYQLVVEEREIPVPSAGEVLIQTRANGICGSDLHLYQGTHPYRSYPMYPGHEGTGRVVAWGETVSGFQAGETVIIEPLIHCGRCYPCRQGRTNACSNMLTVGISVPGSLGEYFVVPAHCLYKIPETVPPHIAALAEPFAVGFQAVARGQVQASEFVAIIGAGPIGLATLAAAKLRGAHVAVMDLIDSRLALAQSFGAELTLNSTRKDPVEELREWTRGDMPAVVIEAVGSPRTIELAVQLAADAGRVVIEGVTEQTAQVRGVDFTRKELTVYGSRNNLHQFQNAIDYVLANQRLVEKMVTHQFPLEQTIQAFELADAHPEQVAKIVITLAE